MKLSVTLFLAAALGSSAHASRHGHRHVHRSVAGGEFVMAKRPVHSNAISVEAPVSTTAEASSSTPAPSSSEQAPPESSSSGPLQMAAQSDPVESNSVESDPEPKAPSSGAFKPFCGGKVKRATLGDIFAKGFVGLQGMYGCNMMEITSDIVSMYDYTAKFVNQGDKKQKCVVWNKIGPDGGVNGCFKNNEVLKFTLEPKGNSHDTVHIAFHEDSQVGASCDAGEVPVTSFGQFAATWFEADFGSSRNKGWSGFDVSTLVADRFKLKTPGMKICSEDNSVCSTVTGDGKGGKAHHDNAYIGGMEDLDGVGGNIHPGRAAFTVMVDYKENEV